jgi:hypothetical protein
MSFPVLYRILKERIHNRHQRPIHKLPEEIPQPNAADGDGCDNVQPAEAREKRQSFSVG